MEFLRGMGHALRVIAPRRKARTLRAALRDRGPKPAAQPPRTLNEAVCCSTSALTSTGRPAISSRKGEVSSGVSRTMPLCAGGGGFDQGDVGHASVCSSTEAITRIASGSSRKGNVAAPGDVGETHVGGGGGASRRRSRPTGCWSSRRGSARAAPPASASKSGQRSGGTASGAKAGPTASRKARVVAVDEVTVGLRVEAARERGPGFGRHVGKGGAVCGAEKAAAASARVRARGGLPR